VKTGRIVSWSPSFGFIEPDDGGRQVFYCATSCAPHQDYMQLRRGDYITFEITSDPKHFGKLMATNLAWTTGAEPGLRELDRRAAREGNPEEWRSRRRA
jgi:cold shock CspA family protein